MGSQSLHLSSPALAAMTACVDTFGRFCGEAMNSALLRQMAILEPINDHAYTLPVCPWPLASDLGVSLAFA
jgi:hypothetical protein